MEDKMSENVSELDDEEAKKDFLVDKAKEAINHQLDSGEGPFDDERPERPELRKKRNKMDEKVEGKASSKTGAPWSMEEIEFLKNNRSEMSNEELEEFMNRDSEFHEVDWEPFSRSQERYIIQSYRTSDLGELADQLDRDENVLRLKMRMMGLEVPEED